MGQQLPDTLFSRMMRSPEKVCIPIAIERPVLHAGSFAPLITLQASCVRFQQFRENTL